MVLLRRREAIQFGGSLLFGASAAVRGGSRGVDACAVPTTAQQVWQDCEIGLIYHFDLPVASGRYAPNNTYRKTIDPNLYQPRKLDTDQWLEAAKVVGAKYAIFTATHFSGFMQWQSELYPYGLRQTSWRNGRGDVVGAFVDSCRKAGVLPGIYFSTHRNVYWNVWGHYADEGRGRGTARQQEFNRVAESMTEELCSRYGKLVQIWYDAGVKTPAEGGPDVLPVFEKHQPDSVFYHSRQRSDHRWIGNEHGHAGDPCWARMPIGDGVSHNDPSWRDLLHSGDIHGEYWSPGMVDVPLRGHGAHNWFWSPDEDHAAYPVNRLMKMYYESVGRNCNLVLGEVITREGEVPLTDIDRLADFGRELKRRFSTPVVATRGTGSMLELKLNQPTKIDHVELMEDIRHGERVRAYVCEALVDANRWEALCQGASIGHKRLHQFAPRKVGQVRLRIDSSIATPILRRFALHATSP